MGPGPEHERRRGRGPPRALRLALAAGAALMCAASPVSSRAAEVVQVVRARQGSGGVAYLRLAKGEAVRAGEKLRAPSGELVVLEAVGRRARASWGRRAPRAGDHFEVGRRVGAEGVAGAEPGSLDARLRRQAWKTQAPGGRRAGLDPREAAIFWSRARLAPRPLVVARRTRTPGGDRRGEGVQGDIVLTAAAVATGAPFPSWAGARLSSRMRADGLWGMPFVYRHALSIYGDTVGATQGGARARRSLEVRRLSLSWEPGASRVWARGGRVLAATGTAMQQVDGVVAGARFGALEVEVHGGLSPDVTSLGPRLDASRYGALLRWRPSSGTLRGEAQLGWSGARSGGGAEAHLIGARLRAERAGLGELLAELDVAAGAPDLQGTALQGQVPRSSLRPVRAWVGLTTRRFARWRARLRYSHAVSEATREQALLLPWDAFVSTSDHGLLLSADGELSGGWWLSPWLHGGYADSGERFDGWRYGGGLRGGWRGAGWSWRARSYLSVAEHASSATLGAGTRHALGRRLTLSLDARYRLDDLRPQTAVAHRLRLGAGVDWLSGPWTVAVLVGGEQVLAGQGGGGADKLGLLDASLLLRRRL